MPTRIYTQSSGTPDVTPATWNFANQINPVTVPGTTTPNTGSTMTSSQQATASVNPNVRAMGRTIIGPLAAQTISGTIKGQMRGLESNAGANATLALAVKIIQPDGTDRGVLLAQTASDATTQELPTGSLTNRPFQDDAENTSITLTSQAASAGDYLVIEWGFRSATGVARTVTLSYGNDNATDLGENSTDTTAFNPWWEFSQDISFTTTPQIVVTDGVTLGETIQVISPLAVALIDGVTLGEVRVQGAHLPAGSVNAAYSFANAQSFTIPGTAHGLGTAALVTQAYDLATPHAWISLGSVTVDATSFDIVVTMDQPQDGYLVLNGAPAQAGNPGNYAQSFSGVSSVTVSGASHGMQTRHLLVQVYDNAATPAQVTPGSITIDSASNNDVTVTFRQNQNGTVVVCGYANTAATKNSATTFSGQSSVTVSSHGYPTNNLLVQVYDNGSPAAQLTPGSITLNPVSHAVTVTFDQNQSGTVVIDGSQAAAGFAPAVTEALTLGETVTVKGLLLTLSVTDGLTVGEVVTIPGLTMPLAPSDGLAVGETVSVFVPFLAVPVIDALTAGETVSVFMPFLAVPITAALTVGDTVTSLVPFLAPVVLDALTLGDSPTVSALALAVIDPLTVSEALTVFVPFLAVPVVDVLTVGDPASLLIPFLAPVVSDGLTLGEVATVFVPFLAPVVSDGLTLGDPVTVTLSGVSDTLNYEHAFLTPTTSVSIPAATHGAGTADLLIQVYDDSTPRRMLDPGSVTVDATANITVTFRQNQTGYVVVNGGTPQLAAHQHRIQPFTSQQTITMPGSQHGFGTTALLVQVYDTTGTPIQLPAGSITVHPSTFDVVVTFDQPQTGHLLVGAYARTNAAPNYSQAFTNTASVTVAGSSHGFRSTDLFVQVYDDATTPTQVIPGSVTVSPASYDVTVTLRQAQSGRVVVNGVPILALAVTDALTVGETDGLVSSTPLTNYGYAFTAATVITVPGASHGAGHANLLVQVYDNATPRNRITPAAIAVDTSSFDVMVTLLDTLSGTVVVNGAIASTAGLVNVPQPFTNTTTIVIPGSSHALGTPNLLVQVYDNSSPEMQFAPAAITVDPSTYDVVMTLDEATSGLVVLNSAYRTGATPNVGIAFTNTALVVIPAATHNLGTRNLIIQVYDNGSPLASQIEPASVMVHPSSYDVTVTLAQTMSGMVVLNGASFGFTVVIPEPIVLGDTPTLWTSRLYLSVTDTLVMGEAPTPGTLVIPLIVNEAVTLTETVVCSLLVQSAIVDSLTLSESITVLALVQPAVSETVAFGETVTLSLLAQPGVSDVVPVGETLLVVLSQLPLQVTDALTVGETPTVIRNVPGILALAVSDNVVLGEPVSLIIATKVSATEALVLAEQVTLDLIGFVTGGDALTIGDIVTTKLVQEPSCSDVVTLSDTTIVMALAHPSVADAFVVGDAPVVMVVLHLSSVDSLTLGEQTPVVRGVVNALNVAVSDDLTLADTATVVSLGFPAVTDAVTAQETVSVMSLAFAVVSDAVTSGETVVSTLLALPLVADAVSLSDTTGVITSVRLAILENLTVDETPLVSTGGIVMALTELLLLGEPVTLRVPFLPCVVTDPLAVDEIVTVATSALTVTIIENVTVSETVSLVEPVLLLTVTDALTLDEIKVVSAGDIAFVTTDSLAVGDMVALRLPILLLPVTDDVTLGELVMPAESALRLAVIETQGIGETSTASLGALTIQVTDGVTLGETTADRVPFLAPIVFEPLTLGEPILLASGAIILPVAEVLVVVDTPLANLILAPVAIDNVTATDTVVVTLVLEPFVIEPVAVSDITIMFALLLPQIQEVVGVGEQVPTTIGIVPTVIRSRQESLTMSRGIQEAFVGSQVLQGVLVESD